MPSWKEVLEEIQISDRKDALDAVRRKYLSKLHNLRGRNVICYYSGWLQKPGVALVEINDNDKNSLMAAIHGLDRTKGLDLILHTPGGQVDATESLVSYLRQMFDRDVIAFVPQIAMSAGTMIACSCREIYMGKHSNLGPIDPQFGGISAIGVIEEFEKACEEIKDFPERIPLWREIIGKYHPTFLGECKNAIDWSKSIVTEWLATGMFRDEENSQLLAKNIVEKLSDKSLNKVHARHLSAEYCKEFGLKISCLEDDDQLQDLVLTIHHAFNHTFANSPATKIVENHLGVATVLNANFLPN